jgi:hypothetical protein
MFKVSFVEPQIGQQQDRQQQDRRQQERRPQEDQREAVNIRWHTINQSTRKLVRQKDSTTTSAEPPDKGGASAGNSINREKLIELPTDCPTEPPEPLQHQKSIQTNIKQSGRRQQRKVDSQPEELVESVEKPVQGRIVRSRRARDVQNT